METASRSVNGRASCNGGGAVPRDSAEDGPSGGPGAVDGAGRGGGRREVSGTGSVFPEGTVQSPDRGIPLGR
jgi:hypothetical protein